MWLRPPRLHKSAVSCDVHHGNVDRPNSSAGRHLLCGHLLTLPDNKIVEDVHQPIRLHGKGNVNRKQKSLRIQDIIAHSGVLEQRGVRNVGTVDKALFLREYPKTKRRNTAGLFKCRTHKLPVEWARMCHNKKLGHRGRKIPYRRRPPHGIGYITICGSGNDYHETAPSEWLVGPNSSCQRH